jgi:uncharacterized protein (DUF58 family)
MAQRLVLLSSMILGLLVLGLAARNGALLVLALPFVLYLTAGLLFGPDALRLEVIRSVSADYATPGEAVDVRLSVTNQGAQLEEVLFEDIVSPPTVPVEGESSLLTALEPGETVELAYTLTAARGYYRFHGVRATAQDRFGLFRRRTIQPAPGQFFVVPEILRLRHVAIRPSRTRVYSGLIPARQGGPGVDFFGVREYQAGDPLHWINWKATARTTQSLFTNEYEQERIADVGLILDVRRRSYLQSIGDPIFEQAVLATAALAETFLASGNRVGLLLYGMLLDWTLPGYGKTQRRRILHALARAEPGDSMIFDRLEHLPTRLFAPQSQLVVISPLLDDDIEPLIALRAHDYSLMVISPDPISNEEAHWGRRAAVTLATRAARVERALVIHRLRQAGARVLDWSTELPFQQAVYTALGRAPLWRRAIRTRA